MQKFADILEYIPQRPPFVMIDKLVSVSGTETVSELTIRPENLFCENGLFYEGGLIENIAQTVAAGAGYRIRENGEKPSMGMIGTVKRFVVTKRPHTSEILHTTVKLIADFENALVIEGTIFGKQYNYSSMPNEYICYAKHYRYATMRRIVTITFLLLLSNFLNAQSKKEALTSDTIVWFGLDFSEARFINEQAFKSADELKNNLFERWNRIILAEPEKYNVSKFFKVPCVKTELGEVYNRNEKVDASKIILDLHSLDYSLTEEKVNQIISQYVTSCDGYGLVFIIENFNKIGEKGSMWVTYFYIPTKQVMFTKRMIGEAGGIGIKNFWAGAIYNVFEKSLNEKSKWKKE